MPRHTSSTVLQNAWVHGAFNGGNILAPTGAQLEVSSHMRPSCSVENGEIYLKATRRFPEYPNYHITYMVSAPACMDLYDSANFGTHPVAHITSSGAGSPAPDAWICGSCGHPNGTSSSGVCTECGTPRS